MKLMKEKTKEAFKELKEKLGLKNIMQSPKIIKVVVNSGVCSFSDKKKIDIVVDRLAKITGQKPIKKGDKVIVITGKDKDKSGVVLRAFPKYFQVLVEGVNKKKLHKRPQKSNEKGKIIEQATPIHVSNVEKIQLNTNT